MIKFRYKRKESKDNNAGEKGNAADGGNTDASSNKKSTLKKNSSSSLLKPSSKDVIVKNETSQSHIREDYLECIRAVVVSFYKLNMYLVLIYCIVSFGRFLMHFIWPLVRLFFSYNSHFDRPFCA